MASRTVIESYCERCGTRYTFEPPKQRGRRLVDLGKTLGLVDSEGDPEAISLTASRDPFHGTFHFCLECRQYTCPGCWNAEAGFCQGCVPIPGNPDLVAAETAATSEADSDVRTALEEIRGLGLRGAWPRMDLPEPPPERVADEPQRLGAVAASPGDDAPHEAPEPVAPEPVAPEVFESELVAPELVAAATLTSEQVDSAAELLAVEPGAEWTLVPEPDHSVEPERAAPIPVPAPAIAARKADPGTFTWIEPDPGAVVQDAAEAADSMVEAETMAAAEPDAEVVDTTASAAEAETEGVEAVETEVAVEAAATDVAVEAEAEAEAVEAESVAVEAEVAAEEVESFAVEAEAEAVEAIEAVEAEAEPATVEAEAEAVEPEAEALEAEPATVEAEAEVVTVEAVEAEAEAVAVEAAAVETTTVEEPSAESEAGVVLIPLAAEQSPQSPDVDPEWEALLRDVAALAPEPTGDDLATVDWAALAGSLGPDVDVSPPPAPAPPPVAPPQPPPPAASPAPPAQLTSAWQVTAPDIAPTPGWPPIGPVYQPRPGSPPPTGGVPHAAMLSAAPGASLGASAGGRSAMPSAAGTHLPNGVRPCNNCALPLSAQARFCRRCGRSQV